MLHKEHHHPSWQIIWGGVLVILFLLTLKAVLPSRQPLIHTSQAITPVPTGTITPSCIKKSQGDADCNNLIDFADFEQWRKEFMGMVGSKLADFNSDTRITIADFERWRTNYFAIQPTITPTLAAGACLYPSQKLNLINWKVTLPSGSLGNPTEIKQPQLATYTNDPYFKINPDCTGVQFRAHTSGETTSGSSYPRSELREMSNNGSTNASWSNSSGTHTMIIDEAIMAVPQTKKHVVAGQIHDANDDVIVIRLEYPKLFIDINGTDGPILDANYTLGERFTVKFVASGGTVQIYYNGAVSPAYTLNRSFSGGYFKAGAYTQSNCSTESGGCGTNNYGEVHIYNLEVLHQ